MAFTNSLNVTVGDATKADDYNDLADNTEFNRDNSDAEHNFDISTGDGSHKNITATKLTMSGDIELEGQQQFFDSAKAVELVSTASKTLDLEIDGLTTTQVTGGTGANTQFMVKAPATRDAYHLYSDTTGLRYAVGYDASRDLFSINRSATLGTSKNWEMDSEGRITSNMSGVTDVVAGYAITADNASDNMLGLKVYNSGAAAVDSGSRVGFNVQTTTNGETPIAYIDGVVKNIGSSSYRGELQFLVAGNGAAPVARATVRSGYSSGPIFETRAPDGGEYGLVLRNDSFSTSSEDGFLAYVANGGTTNLLAFKSSTSAYQSLNVNAATFSFSSFTTGQFDFKVGANTRFELRELYLSLPSYDNGTGTGRYALFQRNSNGSTPAAGHLQMQDKSGTTYYVWPDDNGKLRIGTTPPTNINDTSGSIVGTQS